MLIKIDFVILVTYVEGDIFIKLYEIVKELSLVFCVVVGRVSSHNVSRSSVTFLVT